MKPDEEIKTNPARNLSRIPAAAVGLPLLQPRNIKIVSSQHSQRRGQPPKPFGAQNRTIDQYLILAHASPDELGILVLEKIQAGWQPYGSPLLVGASLAQCVVKYR